ncbi:hypothetical protein MKK75_01390 [Methylobacterium sp. J-030]|uniref:hypothetical protein n=1 Tax=Methylobacterium sp. J-030 TaxID=2836627 RepID=UPI001FBA9150|nr:hypothetical protein [Methylobacterium sp. J-030]MCJ2067470.1 hypothetical protein [Methylobacterium sp. J-030]
MVATFVCPAGQGGCADSEVLQDPTNQIIATIAIKIGRVSQDQDRIEGSNTPQHNGRQDGGVEDTATDYGHEKLAFWPAQRPAQIDERAAALTSRHRVQKGQVPGAPVWEFAARAR